MTFFHTDWYGIPRLRIPHIGQENSTIEEGYDCQSNIRFPGSRGRWQKVGTHVTNLHCLLTIVTRYALHLVDTVHIGADKTVCITNGVKALKDTMFYLNQEEEDVKASKPAKKAPSAKSGANGNPSPMKNKTAGGKVLRNKTRSAAQEEQVQSAVARIAEHQRELHERLQTEGFAKFSEGGGGLGGKEGKGWKRFQSYKGEGALPREVENLRVSMDYICLSRHK